MDFTSAELSSLANTTPSETLEQDLLESVDSGIERQIAEVQTEANDKIQDALEKVPLIRKCLRTKYPTWTKTQVNENIADGLDKLDTDLKAHARCVIEQLEGLREYRRGCVEEWLEKNELVVV